MDTPSHLHSSNSLALCDTLVLGCHIVIVFYLLRKGVKPPVLVLCLAFRHRKVQLYYLENYYDGVKRFHCVTPNTTRRSFGNVNALTVYSVAAQVGRRLPRVPTEHVLLVLAVGCMVGGCMLGPLV
jgi:hypothetical protein